MHQFHIPQFTIRSRNAHISILNGVLWNMGLVHCGVVKIVYSQYFWLISAWMPLQIYNHKIAIWIWCDHKLWIYYHLQYCCNVVLVDLVWLDHVSVSNNFCKLWNTLCFVNISVNAFVNIVNISMSKCSFEVIIIAWSNQINQLINQINICFKLYSTDITVWGYIFLLMNVVFVVSDWKTDLLSYDVHMMTSSNGNIFHGTGHLCGEFTGQRWIPLTKANVHMMTSSNGNIFPVTGHLCGEFTGQRWIPHRRGALMCSFICVWINSRVNTHEAGDLRRYRAHYDVIVMRNELWRPYACDNVWGLHNWFSLSHV